LGNCFIDAEYPAFPKTYPLEKEKEIIKMRMLL